MKISKLVFSIGIFFFSTIAFSQANNDTASEKTKDTVTGNEQKRLKFGCGFGLSFVGGTNISLSPNLIYKVSDVVAIGAGVQGSYTAIKGLQNTTTYGANLLTQFSLSKKITTSLEFAQLRVSTKTEVDNSTKKYWDSALFVGVGYNITSKISVGAKYNLLYKDGESIYTSPVIPFVNISF
ncbi:hypothetical protein VP395_00235 [Mariniflexile soesokkakense]|uniref:Outer membrane protein beta-barrel domain-containing protein n=1 Tax=Mariniflexile soesokkakense TaxID=1343160 RepID=A0ABV0A9F4_9FLAO